MMVDLKCHECLQIISLIQAIIHVRDKTHTANSRLWHLDKAGSAVGLCCRPNEHLQHTDLTNSAKIYSGKCGSGDILLHTNTSGAKFWES